MPISMNALETFGDTPEKSSVERFNYLVTSVVNLVCSSIKRFKQVRVLEIGPVNHNLPDTREPSPLKEVNRQVDNTTVQIGAVLDCHSSTINQVMGSGVRCTKRTLKKGESVDWLGQLFETEEKTVHIVFGKNLFEDSVTGAGGEHGCDDLVEQAIEMIPPCSQEAEGYIIAANRNSEVSIKLLDHPKLEVIYDFQANIDDVPGSIMVLKRVR